MSSHLERQRFARRAWNVSRTIQIYVSNEGTARSFVNQLPVRRPDAGDQLPFDVVDSLLREVKGYGLDAVTLGGYDPLSWPGLEATLELARDLNFWVTIRTDGWAIEEALPLLETWKNDVATVWVELAGMNEATHDDLVGRPGSHQRALTTVLECLKRRISVGIEWAIQPENHGETRDYLAYLCDMELRKGVLHLRSGNPHHSARPMTPEEQEAVHSWIFDDLWDDIRRMEYLRVTDPGNEGWEGCRHHLEHAPYQIGPTGRVVPCTVDLAEPGDRWPVVPEEPLIECLMEIDRITGGTVIAKTRSPDHLNLGRYPIPCQARTRVTDTPSWATALAEE